MQVDYGYSAHRRTVAHISGTTLKGEPYVAQGPVTILENRVNGKVRSVTILSDDMHNAPAVARLQGESARY